jgi:hypothetical protein
MLWVAADGPRFPEEESKCRQARAVLERVDWDCRVLTDFSYVNLGCGRREASAFDWVFSHCQEAILLEDDTLPSPSFFRFCESLLERYREDERVMQISGNNFQCGQSRTAYSYYFSQYVHCWGWASWRRAWKHYDYRMKTWPEFKSANGMGLVRKDPYEQRYWTAIFDRTFAGQVDTWDYQWVYACWAQNGLSIVPAANLVTNIGFGAGATHTVDDKSPLSNMPVSDIWEIRHPPFVVRHREADAFDFDFHFGGKHIRERDTLRGKIGHALGAIKRRLRSWV